MGEIIETLAAYKGLAVIAWFALFFLGERLRPAVSEREVAALGDEAAASAPARQGWPRVARNLGLLAFNFGLSPLVVLPLSFWAAEHTLAWRPGWLGGPFGLLFDVLLLDFLIYWWHRANHEVPFLWRFHEIHHLDRFLDSTTALRFHFGEVLLSAGARACIIILFDIPFTSILVFETVILLASIFHHSNLKLPVGLERLLARIVITPSIHWVHHHRVRSDTDSNYGTILSIWDPLFASRSETGRYADMPIGVEAREERRFIALLGRPFGLEFGRAERAVSSSGAGPAARHDPPA